MGTGSCSWRSCPRSRRPRTRPRSCWPRICWPRICWPRTCPRSCWPRTCPRSCRTRHCPPRCPRYCPPFVHAAPAYHAPLRAIAHPVAHAVAEVYPDEVSPYTYQYAVADDYSGSNFQAAETDDGTAARTGSYSVALPDGRTQHVSYTANDIDGYVATVTYDGQAAYPQAVAVAHPVAHAIARPVAYAAPVVHAAPLVHAAVHAAPVYRGAGQVSHQSVSKPYQGEHRATTQSKAFGATVAAVHDSPSRLNGAHSRNGLALVGHGALIG